MRDSMRYTYTHMNTAQPIPSTWAMLLVQLLAALLPWTTAAAAPAQWAPLQERLEADGYPAEMLTPLFADKRMVFDPEAMASKLRGLLASRLAATAAGTGGGGNATAKVDKPSATMGLLAMAAAYGYLAYYRETLDRLHRTYGVSPEVLVAVLLVESRLGWATGEAPALATLGSMALARDFELVRPRLKFEGPEQEQWLRSKNADKADWAYREIKALLDFARRSGRNPLAIPGSSSGAIGMAQFMPSNLLAYGADGDGDGVVDPFSTADALASIASFLRAHGWKPALPRDEQEDILLHYNRDRGYARMVLDVAERLSAHKS